MGGQDMYQNKKLIKWCKKNDYNAVQRLLSNFENKQLR